MSFIPEVDNQTPVLKEILKQMKINNLHQEQLSEVEILDSSIEK